ncbi:MAG: primase C-terminal domain-containing protein [Candidatus Hodarchaeota archaeon]
MRMNQPNKPQTNKTTVHLKLTECSSISSRIGASATINGKKISSEIWEEALVRSRSRSDDEKSLTEFLKAFTEGTPDGMRRAGENYLVGLKRKFESIGYLVEVVPTDPLVFGDKREFFKQLFSECAGEVELRAFPSKGRIFTRDLRQVNQFCTKHQKENLYFGVATRKKGASSGGKKDCCKLPGLWVDVDRKDVSDTELSKLTQAAPLKPSVVVFSGNGYHLYFLFKEPVEATPEVEKYLCGLARYFKGDTAAAEIARILRIPETLNYKYSPPEKVGIIEANDYRYNLEDFEVFVGPEDKEVVRKNEPGWEKPIIERGVKAGARNEAITQLAGRYIAKGLSREEVLPILLDANGRFEPPLDQDEVERTIDSVIKTHERNHPQGSEGKGEESSALKILEGHGSTETLHPAQDFKLGLLWYGIPVDGKVLLVNSSRQLIRIDKLPDGLVLNNKGFNLCRFSKDGIMRFLGGAVVPGDTLATGLVEYFKRFLIVKDPRVFLLLALWTMGTYVYRIFRVFPYLSLRSPTKECGKSRTEDLLSVVCFTCSLSQFFNSSSFRKAMART